MNVLGCRCNGDTDKFGRGGECTDGEKGRWCFVNKDACKWKKEIKGKFVSKFPCKNQQTPNKPCVCNCPTQESIMDDLDDFENGKISIEYQPSGARGTFN